jgi:hypothetical protein
MRCFRAGWSCRKSAENPAPYLAVKWIPPKCDWVDPLKDRKAEIEAIEVVNGDPADATLAGVSLTFAGTRGS